MKYTLFILYLIIFFFACSPGKKTEEPAYKWSSNKPVFKVPDSSWVPKVDSSRDGYTITLPVHGTDSAILSVPRITTTYERVRIQPCRHIFVPVEKDSLLEGDLKIYLRLDSMHVSGKELICIKCHNQRKQVVYSPDKRIYFLPNKLKP